MILGVAISTRNRRALLQRSLAAWRRHAPPGLVIVVVDDASDEPVPEVRGVAVIRHEHRLGVAMTKNDGIAALMDAGCEHLFLADDDIYPLNGGWWRPYVDSPEPHLSYQGPKMNRMVGCDAEHYAVEFPKGYLLYAQRAVIDAVGGMDPAFGTWGGEHVEWQRRIHDAGLTRWPYADVRDSDRLWRTLMSRSSFPARERRRIFAANGLVWTKPRPRFVSYRKGHSVQDWSLGPEIPDDGTRSPVLSHILALQPTGVAVEFGVGVGDSARLIAKQMPLIGFDSGLGLPERWRDGYEKGALAFPLPDIDNATMIEGWFEDTLPTFDFAALGYIGLVHLDADVYSSTATALKYIGPYLKPGTYVCMDEALKYDGHEDHELRAWREFADRTGIGWSVVGYCGEVWGIRIG